MPKVLVLFSSRTGHTAAFADAIAEGASSVKFTEVDVRSVADLAPERALQSDAGRGESREGWSRKYATLESVDVFADYDALIFGSPTRYGVMSAELKHVLDQAEPLVARGALVDKVGSAFATASAADGGRETAIQSILIPMMHYGMILVPPAYPSSTDADLKLARDQGARVAKVAEWVRHSRSHERGHSHSH